MSFKFKKSNFKVFSKTLDAPSIESVTQTKVGAMSLKLAYEKIIVKDKKEKVSDDETIQASENLDSSNIFKAVFKKGINPYRPEVVLTSEFQPVTTGNFSDFDNNTQTLNFGANKVVEITNVARLIELQAILKRNAIFYSSSLIRRYGNSKISLRQLIRLMERFLRSKRNFNKIYASDTDTIKSNLIKEVRKNSRNPAIAKRIQSADPIFLDLCASYCLNKYAAREISLFVARLFDYKEKIEKSIELSSRPRIRPKRHSPPKRSSKRISGKNNKIKVKNLLMSPILTNITRNVPLTLGSALGSVRKNSQSNLSRSNFENFVNLTAHLYSLIKCHDTIKDLNETNYEIKNSITYGRKGNLRNALNKLRKIKFAGCFSEPNVRQTLSDGASTVSGQTITDIIDATDLGAGNTPESVAEIISAICFDQVAGQNFQTNETFQKISSLSNQYKSSLNSLLTENLIKVTPLRAFDGKDFQELKEETDKHGTFLKMLFDKRTYQNKDYVPYETNNTIASNIYAENDVFPGEEIFYTSAIKANDRTFSELKNFSEEIETSFENIAKNLMSALSLGFDEDGYFLDESKTAIDNLNPMTYFNFYLKSLADELENSFFQESKIFPNLPGLAINMNAAANFDTLADTFCGTITGIFSQEKLSPFWADDSWAISNVVSNDRSVIRGGSTNFTNFVTSKFENIYATLISECKFRTSNGFQAILENLDARSFPRPAERFGRFDSIKFDSYLFHSTSSKIANFDSGKKVINIGVSSDNHFNVTTTEVETALDNVPTLNVPSVTVPSPDSAEPEMREYFYGNKQDLGDTLRDKLNLDVDTNTYPYGSINLAVNMTNVEINNTINGSLGDQSTPGCQFSSNATFMTRVLVNSALGSISRDSAFELPNITEENSEVINNFRNINLFSNRREDTDQTGWRINNYPSNQGEFAPTTAIQRALMFYIFSTGLLSSTQRIQARTQQDKFYLKFKDTRMTGLIKALRGEDLPSNALDSTAHAYQEASERISLVREKIMSRQDYILRCLAVLSDKISSLKEVYKNLTNFIEGSDDDKNFKFVKKNLDENKFFENTFPLLNNSYKDYLAKSFIKNFGRTHGFFPKGDVPNFRDLKIMYKLFSRPGYGFLNKEKFGRKTIYNVGIPLGMIDYLRREAYRETGDEDYLDSSLITITFYKNNQVSANTKYLPKQFIFDMSKYVMPFYCNYYGAVKMSNQVKRMSDDISLEKIIDNFEVLTFNEGANFGLKKNGIGPSGMKGNQTSELADNYENDKAFSEDLIINHILDHYLKLYMQYTTGLQIDESVFLVDSENINVGEVDNSKSNEFKNKIIQNFLLQYPNIAQDEKTRETFFRAANSINNSILMSSGNRLKEMITMPVFERVYSVFINERDFLLDSEEAEDLFKTQPSINRTCELQRRFVNSFKASTTKNKQIKNYLKEINDKHVSLSGFSIDIGLLKKW